MKKGANKKKKSTALATTKSKGLSLQFLKLQDCRGLACPINDECPFLREGTKCKVEEAFYQPILRLFDKERGIGDVVDQLTVTMFNQTIMHMERHLFKFVISERAIKGDVIYEVKGRKLAYPQFEEIRRTMHLILIEMKTLGIFEKWERKFGSKASIPMPTSQDIDDVLQTGKRGAYEEMANMGPPTDDGDEEEEE